MAKEITKSETTQVPTPMDPFSAMRAEMDRVFDNFMGHGWSAPRLFKTMQSEALVPSIDVRENDREIVIEAELPGMEEKDVEVTVRNGLLTIKGEKRIEEEKKEDDYHITERRHGSFQRSLQLPDTVDENKIDASLEKGVLHLTLGKKAEAANAAKKIKVKKKS